MPISGSLGIILLREERVMMSETYRGYRCYYLHPLAVWDWIARDNYGNIIAAATLDELKAEIDAYLEDE